ncbi:NAD(P)-dependent oxidoreductase [Bartonella taylorii]|nr:NAD(P)-dependent oxidoreductase [Bartonella taylorii]
MINPEFLKKMKKNAILVNTARGKILSSMRSLMFSLWSHQVAILLLKLGETMLSGCRQG